MVSCGILWLNNAGQAAKRIIDILSAIVLFAVTLPLFIITAILIKLDSKGPVIFGQKRIGKDKRYFKVYKFRSMYIDSSEDVHKEYIRKLMTAGLPESDNNGKKIYKLTCDPRITPVGRLIRKLSIDELPQIFNVLKGDMSMVGPRPAIPYELEYYDKLMQQRFRVKPGITGLWQVSGRSGTTYRQMTDLDVFYVKHWSIGLDLRIMLKTIVYIFNTACAY